MEKCDIEKLISTKSDRLSFDPCSGYSDVWPNFVKVLIDKKYSSMVKCKFCDSLLKWKSKDGTSGLRAHIKSCKKLTVKSESGESMIGYTPPSKKISAADKTNLIRTCAEMCSKDICPFSFVEGEGFMKLASSLISLGAKYGNDISIESILPCSRSVSRHVSAIAHAQRQSLTSVLSSLWRVAVTTDLWTHEMTKTPYITVTVHYINERWELCCNILATHPMDNSKTGENIKNTVHKILDDFGVLRHNNIYVSDNGSDIKAAFHDQTWLCCFGHNINLVVTHALSDQMLDDQSPLKLVTNLICHCKELVNKVKITQLQNKLPATLKQALVTRWKSTLYMLKSVHENIGTLINLANESNDTTLQKQLLDIDEDLLLNVIKVLGPFDNATKLLSADQTPTLHLVNAVRSQIIKGLSILPTDVEAISVLKTRLQNFSDNYLKLDDLHFIAAILDPRLKNSIITTAGRTKAIQSIREMMEEVPIKDSGVGNETSPPNKKQKIENHPFFGDLYNCEETREVDELDSYLKCSNASANILDYWKSNSGRWPKLSAISKVILAVPATETSSEKVFHLARKMLEGRKTQMSDDNLNNLLFVHGLNH